LTVKPTLFGSRATGTHSERSDVDLTISDEINPLGAEAIPVNLDPAVKVTITARLQNHKPQLFRCFSWVHG
jgi:predicted nucleotidyltransferase